MSASQPERRYTLVCVAPGVQGGGSYDDLDEAIVNSDAHFEVYDTQAVEGESPWVGAYCQEDYDDAAQRWRAKQSIAPICPGCDKPRSECPCGFCHGFKPVGNAASLLDGKPRPPLPCPRCGRVNAPSGEPTS